MIRFNKNIVLLGYFLCWSATILGQNLPEMDSFIPQISRTTLSPTGEEILFSGEDYHGLYLFSVKTNQFQTIAVNPGAGYCASWSLDGSRIYFKLIQGENAQQPVYYDLKRQEIIPLYSLSSTAGVPTLSENGLIAFTIVNDLHILNSEFQPAYHYKLDCYANLAPLSPNGKMVVYNDISDQLWILNLTTGSKTKITSSSDGYFNPIWSSDSKKIVASSLTGYLYSFDLLTSTSYKIGRGSSANWMENGESLLFCEEEWDDRFQLVSSRPVICHFDGTDKQLLDVSLKGQIRFLNYSTKTHKLVYRSENYLTIEKLSQFEQKIQIETQQKILLSELKPLSQPLKPLRNITPELNYEIEKQSFEAPYLHQVYDTPNWFNGHWACGATSAMMALAYYDVLPAWACNCSWPYSHTSEYGRYICEIYSFNGYTYNIGGYDPNGNLGYGGYGFIIKNNWANTKEYMATYARQHKISSSVDWSPSYTKFSNEIDEQFPAVILNSLTSSGHYILGIGYNSTQRSVMINDPYGDKNQGYMNYDGKNVIYDWPGYHNGHANLNIVHCLIYMRLDATDLAPSDFVLSDTLTVGEEVPIQFKVYNKGLLPSDSCSVSLYLSSNRYFNKSDLILRKISIPEIVPDDSLEIDTIVQLPDSLPSSKQAMGVWVDEDNFLKEVNKSNNLFYRVFVIKGYPLIDNLCPLPDAIVNTSRPQIYAHFNDDFFGINLDSIKFYLDGVDITSVSNVQHNEISFTPNSDLAFSNHTVKLEVTNIPGFKTEQEWQFSIGITMVNFSDNHLIMKWKLSQNYPNPFNSTTQFQYEVQNPGQVKIEIFSVEGKLIKILVDDYKSPGIYQCVWSGNDEQSNHVASGIYYYRMTSGDFREIKRMIYLK